MAKPDVVQLDFPAGLYRSRPVQLTSRAGSWRQFVIHLCPVLRIPPAQHVPCMYCCLSVDLS